MARVNLCGLDGINRGGDWGDDGWDSGIFVRVAGMVDLRVEDLVSSRPQPPDNTKKNSRCCMCEEDHRENAQGPNTYRLRMGVVERVSVVGCRKVEGFGLPLNAGALAWIGTLPHLTCVRVP
jgi:hypothetical protein